MKIGVCCGISMAEEVKALGYDYVEENLNRLADMSESEFEELKARYEAIGIPVYSTNCFFPGSISLYAEDGLSQVTTYAEKALARAARLGVEICVLGSGNARAIPEGADPEEISNKFSAIVAEIDRIAGKYGIRIAIEPLRVKETNFIHTVTEAMEIVKRSGAENVGALVDFYHFHMNGEADDGLTPAGEKLIHAHIARPNEDRRMPMEEDIPTVDKWAAMLRDIGYSGNLSLEGRFDLEALKETKAIVDRFR